MTKHDAKDEKPSEEAIGLTYFSNEFPPDDIATILRNIRFLAQDKRHPVLESFLLKATEAVRREIELLPGELRNTFPAFPCITSLWGEHELRQGSLSGAIDGVLLCVVQLGIYIRCVPQTLQSKDTDQVFSALLRQDQAIHSSTFARNRCLLG